MVVVDSKLRGFAVERLGDWESNSEAQGLSIGLGWLRVLSRVAEGKTSCEVRFAVAQRCDATM